MTEKIRKFNPKPNKVCVGDFLFALNRQLADVIDKSQNEDHVKACQYQIMNEIFIQTAKLWCKCPMCIKRADSLIEIIMKHRAEVEAQLERDKLEVQAEA